MSWEDQGRQEHGWFGDGKAPPKITIAESEALDHRISGLAYSLVAHLPRADRGRAASRFDGRSLDRFRLVVRSWIAASNLDREEFRRRLVDPSTSDLTLDLLRTAIGGVAGARTKDDELKAGVALAAAVRQIGLDRWQRFLADAAERAAATADHASRVPVSASIGTDAAADHDQHAATPDVEPHRSKPNSVVPLIAQMVAELPDGASSGPEAEPVPVQANDATQVINPRTGEPLLKPAVVSLQQNLDIGRELKASYSSVFHFGLGSRDELMALLFAPSGMMDYQIRFSKDGKHYNKTYIDFGNYNFGAVSAAAGYSFQDAIFTAGLLNLFGAREKSGPMFNNPRNKQLIQAGFDDYQSGRFDRSSHPGPE